MRLKAPPPQMQLRPPSPTLIRASAVRYTVFRVGACLAAVGVLACLAASCMAWRRGTEPDPLARDLVEVDRLYALRVSEASLRESNDLAANLLITHGPSQEIHWRLARGLEALVYGHAPSEELLHVEAMEWGRKCLDANPAWVSQTRLAGKVTRRSAQRLVESDLRCLEALLVPWIRRVEIRGVSAAIDLEPLGVLATRALELDAEGVGWTPPWAQAMVLGLKVAPSRADVDEALALFVLSEQREPELATPHVDALALQRRMGTLGQGPTLTHPVHASHPWSLENRRAVERQLALMEARP